MPHKREIIHPELLPQLAAIVCNMRVFEKRYEEFKNSEDELLILQQKQKIDLWLDENTKILK